MDEAASAGGLEVPPDILDLDPETVRQLGYWVVDRTVQHLTTLSDRPVVTTGDLGQLADRLGGPVPSAPGSPQDALALLADVALEHQQHGDHPRYFARVPGPSSPVAVLGEWLATGMQAITSSWTGGSGTATLELVVLDWLRESLGLREGTQGVLLSGGSMANTTALITARSARGEGVLYLSDQTHASIKRGAIATGQDPKLVRVLATDDDFRLPAAGLAEAVAADLAVGRRPTLVVATAGTTNTGAMDDLPAIAEVCKRFGLWLHVDGAYGGPAALAHGRNGVHGLELADSLVLDPHKWLFQPYDVACLFVARPGVLHETFAMHPEYLAGAQGGDVDFHNRSLELTRRSRAAKLWLTLKVYGMDTLVAAIRRGIALAEHAERAVQADPRLELVTPAQLGVVTFAGVGASAAEHVRAAAELTGGGFAAASSTVLHGRTVLRLCTINPRTTEADVARTVTLLAESLSA